MPEKPHDFYTRAIHAGEEHSVSIDRGSHVMPIYQTSTFVFDNVDQGANRFAGEEDGYIYSRLGNPTVASLERKMADLENGEAAAGFGSGMGAISATILQLVSSGEHVVAPETLYGCTYAFMTGLLQRMGIEVTFINATDPENIADAIRPNTALLYGETPANPNMNLIDLKALAELGNNAGIPTVVDNTFMSPYCQRPLDWGIDVVVHSATKYIGGHGDVIAGVVVGGEEFIAELKQEVLKDIGAVLSPFDAWLLLRGLKTLPLRMSRHCEVAQQVAQSLDENPEVKVVHYPGLKSHPQHYLAKRQNENGFGGMMSFELKGGYEAGKVLLNNVELCTLAVSLGAVDTLIQHPASMTHSTMDEQALREAGIDQGLVRLSVGLEDPADIMADLEQALKKVAG